MRGDAHAGCGGRAGETHREQSRQGARVRPNHRIGWSVQVPARRAAERNEAAIAAWREETWPVIKGRRRTWAPGSFSKTNLARA